MRLLLALMLVVLTPIGTGEGAHRDQLLDPLFPHVHLHVAPSTHSQPAPLSVGVAIGAGAGAAAESVAPGLTPPVPTWLFGLPQNDDRWQYPSVDNKVRGRPGDPPPDPPPTIN